MNMIYKVILLNVNRNKPMYNQRGGGVGFEAPAEF
jgi:hypothetical protein